MSSAVDICAGAGGWSKAARDLGMEVLGIEWDADACETRQQAGLPTLLGDVTILNPRTFAWARGFIASPPCPSFSRGGKVRGKDDLLCEQAIERLASLGGTAELDDLRYTCEDEASMIVVEPLRWALVLQPEWIALEQVPPVLHLWEKIGEVLKAHGYHVWTGVLNAADYGVPQVRKRAILMASRTRDVTPPAPTHSKKGEYGLPEWRSMASAIGWGFTHRPAPTLPATSKGGPRVLDGGSGARQTVLNAIERGQWQDFPDDRQVSRTGAVRATEAEAGQLQGFPADWPWTGRIQAIRHRQIGNAVPPPLAEAILRQFT